MRDFVPSEADKTLVVFRNRSWNNDKWLEIRFPIHLQKKNRPRINPDGKVRIIARQQNNISTGRMPRPGFDSHSLHARFLGYIKATGKLFIVSILGHKLKSYYGLSSCFNSKLIRNTHCLDECSISRDSETWRIINVSRVRFKTTDS